MQTLILAHANGLPPETYRRALAPLEGRFRVVAPLARPLWEPPEDPARLASWSTLLEDFEREVERAVPVGEKAVGVGHSMGGVALYAAARRHPGRFSSLVLLEPTMLAGPRLYLLKFGRALGLLHHGNPTKSTRRRTHRWPSRAAAAESFRRNPLFQAFDEGVLADFLEHALRARADGSVELRYPREWEARIYETTPADVWRMGPLPAALPVLVVRGSRSDVFTETSARRFRALNPGAHIHEVVGAGHVVAQERPGEVGRLLAEFLNASI